MRQVVRSLWERAQEALAVTVSWLGLFRRPRAKAGRPRKGSRETPRDPQARGIVTSLISHRDRFDCRRSEKTWEDWQRGRPVACDCHETQKAAMAALQEILDRNCLRGRLEPLWPSLEGELTPCVFLPRGIERGTKWRELRNLAWETRWWPVEVDDLGLLVGGFEQSGQGHSIQDALEEARLLDVMQTHAEVVPIDEIPAEGALPRVGTRDQVAPASTEESPVADVRGGEAPGEATDAGSPPAEALSTGHAESPDGLDPARQKPWRFLDDPEADPVPGDFLVLVPTSRPWEIPAHLYYGGGNESPRSAVHVAWWKRWFDHHGAEIRTISGNAVDLYVPRRPTTREEARILLQEHGRYCPLTLGVNGSVDEERALDRLLKNHAWAFWWD